MSSGRTGPSVGAAHRREIGPEGGSGRAVGPQIGQCRGGAWQSRIVSRLPPALAIDVPGAVGIVVQMAVDALHAEIDMDESRWTPS